MINHTVWLAHTGKTNSQMLCWARLTRSNRQSTNKHKNIKVVVAPVNTPAVGVDNFANFLKQS